MINNGTEIRMSRISIVDKQNIIEAIESFKKLFDHGRKVAAFIGPSITNMSEEKANIAFSMTTETEVATEFHSHLDMAFNDYMMAIRGIIGSQMSDQFDWVRIEAFKTYANLFAKEAKNALEGANSLYPEDVIEVKKFFIGNYNLGETDTEYMNRAWIEIVHIVDDCWKICENLLEDIRFI